MEGENAGWVFEARQAPGGPEGKASAAESRHRPTRVPDACARAPLATWGCALQDGCPLGIVVPGSESPPVVPSLRTHPGWGGSGRVGRGSAGLFDDWTTTPSRPCGEGAGRSRSRPGPPASPAGILILRPDRGQRTWDNPPRAPTRRV